MPGTPTTSPNFGAPRYSDADTASFSAQVNPITDTFDANAAHLGKGQGYLPGDLIESYASTRAGAVLCDGTAYTLSGHPEMTALAAACPVLVASGVLTVPDLRGVGVIGAGTGPGRTARAVGQTGGAETHVLTVTEMPAHAHTDAGHAHSITGNGTAALSGQGGTAGAEANRLAAAGTLGITNGNANIQNTGGGGAHSIMQPFAVANIFIKL
jgi:microcystin-dependent protein